MSLAIDTSHGCKSGGGVKGGMVPKQQKASSDCCGAKLAVGGTPETGFTCTDCSKPCNRVLSDKVAYWTCHCGVKRSQVITAAIDEPAALTAAVPSKKKGA